MTDFDYDLFVIGAGSGGVRAARIAASHGARVAIAEEYRVGGTCVIRGCVPKKLLVYGSHYHDELADAASYGWSIGTPQFNWPTLRDNVLAEVTRLNGLYTQTLEKNHVTILQARATFVDAHTLDVGGKRVTAKNILIATGALPVLPDCLGAEHGISSNEIFHLPELPRRVLIAGGGYIATEFAGILHGLGVSVTQLYRGHLILKGWDEDCRKLLQKTMIDKGITLHTGASFVSIEKTATGLIAHLTDGTSIETDVIVHAIGRKPNIAGLNLESVRVDVTEAGAIAVNAHYQTSQSHIYAVGDVVDHLQLTPVAIKQGHAVADGLFGDKLRDVDLADVPSAVFSQPSLAAVGLTEEAAKQAGYDVKIFASDFRPMKYTVSGRQERSLCKLVVDAKTDRVLGVHMLGADAAEIIQMAGIAVKLGATKADFDRTIAVHPSAAEEFVLMR
jgi:glutathione reductase (NADPH)